MFATANFDVKLPGTSSESPPYKPTWAVRDGWVSTKYLMDCSEAGLILGRAVDCQQNQRPDSYLPVSGYMLGPGLALHSLQSVLLAARLQMGLAGGFIMVLLR